MLCIIEWGGRDGIYHTGNYVHLQSLRGGCNIEEGRECEEKKKKSKGVADRMI